MNAIHRLPRWIPAAMAALLLSGCGAPGDGQGGQQAQPAATAAADARPDQATAAPSGAGDAVADGVAPGVARAEAAIVALGARLKSALVQRMQAEGPVGAIDFCHDEAPKIAAEVASGHGLRLGRTAARLRNPGNAPEPWQAAVLESFAARAAAGEAPPAITAAIDEGLPEGVALRYMKGIGVEPPCTACHGTAIAADVAAAIAERYPGDAATGFEVGDLRGAFWVEIPEDDGHGP